MLLVWIYDGKLSRRNQIGRYDRMGLESFDLRCSYSIDGRLSYSLVLPLWPGARIALNANEGESNLPDLACVKIGVRLIERQAFEVKLK